MASVEVHYHYSDYPRLVRIWKGMKQRCANPKRAKYPSYGGRGIYVCRAWSDDFSTFCEWALHSGYADDLQLDRIDNAGPYSPENCRWVTVKQNCSNKRSNRSLTIVGITMTVAAWADLVGISRYTLYDWLKHYGEEGCEKRVYKRLYDIT